ncbi:MAG: hypothetical protein HKP08_10195, partial [Flavobacteriaceae bacterium]|nr:hypothetical protein [Flavobacteriaceae bacterium]
MRSILAIGLIAILSLACNSLEPTKITLEEAIPANAALILKVKDPASLKRDLGNCDFISLSSVRENDNELIQILGQLKELTAESQGYFVAIPNSTNSLSYVYISEIAPKEQTRDSINIDSIKVEAEAAEESKDVIDPWFTSETGTLRFYSRDSTLIAEKNWLKSASYPDDELLSLLKNPAPGKEVSLFLKAPQLDSLNALAANQNSSNWAKLANSLALDLKTSQDMLQWTGVGTVTDSTPSLLSLFSHTQPVVNTLASLAPESADGLLTISFTDQAVFGANQQRQFTEANDAGALFQTTEEVGLVFQGKNKGIIINTFGALSLSEFLQESRSSVYDYQGKEIGVLASSALLEEAFPAFISNFKVTHYTVLENAFIFCDNKRFMELMIRNINSEKTFETSAIYESARSELAEASS